MHRSKRYSRRIIGVGKNPPFIIAALVDSSAMLLLPLWLFLLYFPILLLLYCYILLFLFYIYFLPISISFFLLLLPYIPSLLPPLFLFSLSLGERAAMARLFGGSIYLLLIHLRLVSVGPAPSNLDSYGDSLPGTSPKLGLYLFRSLSFSLFIFFSICVICMSFFSLSLSPFLCVFSFLFFACLLSFLYLS